MTTSVGDAVLDVRTSPSPVTSTIKGIGNVASDTFKVLKGSAPVAALGAYFTAQDIKQAMDSNEDMEEDVMKAYEEGAFNFEKGEHPQFPDLSGEELYEAIMKNLENYTKNMKEHIQFVKNLYQRPKYFQR